MLREKRLMRNPWMDTALAVPDRTTDESSPGEEGSDTKCKRILLTNVIIGRRLLHGRLDLLPLFIQGADSQHPSIQTRGLHVQ